MKKVYITRYGAVGDFIHLSYFPRLLKEKAGFDYVAFEYNGKGACVLETNPFIDEHIPFEASVDPINRWPLSVISKRWEFIKETGNFDKHINLQLSIEYGYIAMETMAEYYRGSEFRRNKYGGLNYYDQTAEFAGYPEFKGNKGELYYSRDEEHHAKNFYERSYPDSFVFIVNLSGTSKHKIFYNAETIVKEFLNKHSDAVCLTFGDKDCKDNLEFKGERIHNCAGNCGMRQALLMTKYANCVIGAESGLMVASTMWGTPTVQLMTAASIKNHGGDFQNDYSIQSPAKCSPCHKGPYEYIGCPKFKHLNLDYPICVKFDSNVVLDKLESVYNDYTRRKEEISSSSLSSVR